MYLADFVETQVRQSDRGHRTIHSRHSLIPSYSSAVACFVSPPRRVRTQRWEDALGDIFKILRVCAAKASFFLGSKHKDVCSSATCLWNWAFVSMCEVSFSSNLALISGRRKLTSVKGSSPPAVAACIEETPKVSNCASSSGCSLRPIFGLLHTLDKRFQQFSTTVLRLRPIAITGGSSLPATICAASTRSLRARLLQQLGRWWQASMSSGLASTTPVSQPWISLEQVHLQLRNLRPELLSPSWWHHLRAQTTHAPTRFKPHLRYVRARAHVGWAMRCGCLSQPLTLAAPQPLWTSSRVPTGSLAHLEREAAVLRGRFLLNVSGRLPIPKPLWRQNIAPDCTVDRVQLLVCKEIPHQN